MTILDRIPFQPDLAAVQSSLHVEPGSDDEKEFAAFVEEVTPRARPKAIYEVVFIEDKGRDTVTMGGQTFTSRVLRPNLDRAERFSAYVIPCGTEMDETPVPQDDFLKKFWLDALKAAALGDALAYLRRHLEKTYALGKTSDMSPGSGDVDVWPIEQQRPLFNLFGDVESLIGVRLTDSFLMIPNKSVSGIRFPTEIDFRACQLCHRPNCPSRAAAFDQALFDSLHAEP